MSATKPTVRELDLGQLDLMWSFLQMGHQRANIPALKDLCGQLRQAMIQKTAGQRSGDPKSYVPFGDVSTICNSIVIETMCLYLSGALDRLETERWTELKKKPPEENGKYLCVWQGKSIETGLFLNGHFRLYGENKDRLVSHWRPLPEMPKETNEDE